MLVPLKERSTDMSLSGDVETRAHERCCAHYSRASPATVYTGRDYLRALLGMRGAEAEWLGRMVEPFFWSGADMIRVHLCDDCAALLRIDSASTTPEPTQADPA